MKTQLNPNETSSALLGSIMSVTPGQAKIIVELPPEAQQPAIDICQKSNTDGDWATNWFNASVQLGLSDREIFDITQKYQK